jgi:hypothetical protein
LSNADENTPFADTDDADVNVIFPAADTVPPATDAGMTRLVPEYT